MKELQKKIGYTFQNEGLLKTALTHSSYACLLYTSHERNELFHLHERAQESRRYPQPQDAF